MKQKDDTIICNALYLLFADLYECMIEAKYWKTDENANADY